MDETLLTGLGMNQKEIKIFTAVLKSRELSPAQLSKQVGIKRTTCYSLARGLVEKGFLRENTVKRPRTFMLAQAGDVEATLAEEKKRLAAREKSLKRFTAELSRATAEESYPVPQIRFVGEEKIRSFLAQQSPVWDQTMLKTDPIMWGFQDHTYVENFTDEINRYWQQAPQEIGLKMLTNMSAAEAERKLARRIPRRQMKFWKNSDKFLSGIWIAGEYVIMFNSCRHPFYLVEIHDATLANDLREVFKNLWPLV